MRVRDLGHGQRFTTRIVETGASTDEPVLPENENIDPPVPVQVNG